MKFARWMTAVVAAVMVVSFIDGYGKGKDISASKSKYDTVESLRRAAGRGDAEAQYRLARRYMTGDGVPRNPQEAFKLIRKSADQNHAGAQAVLGMAYLSGMPGGSKDEGLRLIQRSAQRGNAVGQATLGQLYLTGMGMPKNERKGIFLMRKAADSGDPDGQMALASCYRDGRGVPKNDQEAIRWYQKSADQGNANAWLMLGLIYKDQGKLEDAIRCFSKAGDQGNANAWLMLGFIYKDQGKLEDAIRCFSKAGDQGRQPLGNCFFTMGKNYELGIGCVPNQAEAVKWYRQAANLGNEFAKEALNGK